MMIFIPAAATVAAYHTGKFASGKVANYLYPQQNKLKKIGSDFAMGSIGSLVGTISGTLLAAFSAVLLSRKDQAFSKALASLNSSENLAGTGVLLMWKIADTISSILALGAIATVSGTVGFIGGLAARPQNGQ